MWTKQYETNQMVSRHPGTLPVLAFLRQRSLDNTAGRRNYDTSMGALRLFVNPHGT
jgi:hypothetical protein